MRIGINTVDDLGRLGVSSIDDLAKLGIDPSDLKKIGIDGDIIESGIDVHWVQFDDEELDFSEENFSEVGGLIRIDAPNTSDLNIRIKDTTITRIEVN